MNNALNGVSMNLEVVRLRARAGTDGGAAAPFARAAAADHEATVALVGALLALGRAPRAAVDVGEVVAQAAALYAPLLRHHGVALAVTPAAAPASTGAPARAVRLAVCAALERVYDDAERRRAPGAGGVPPGAVRCTLHAGPGPALVIAPAPAGWPDDLGPVLAAAGVDVRRAPDGLRLTFPPV